MSRKTCLRAMLTPWLLYIAGCSSFDLRKNIPWGEGLNGEFSAPMKVMPVWTDTVMYQAGRAPQRGFGGRFFFHKEENGPPVKVRGTLEVYAFDEAGRGPADSRPTRKYVFTPEQFQKHYSKSDLGHSYSVFIPWDELGGPQRQITLVTRFVPDGAPLVVSEPSRQSLPGLEPAQVAQQPPPIKPFGPVAAPAPPASQPAANRGPSATTAQSNGIATAPVHQAAYQSAETPTPSDGAEQPQMSTLTIPVRGQALSAMPRSTAPQAMHPLAPPVLQSSPLIQPGSAIGFGQVQQLQGPNPPTLAPQPAARSALERHRALGAPLAPLPRDREPWQRPRVGWPSAPPGSPPAGSATGSGSHSAGNPAR